MGALGINNLSGSNTTVAKVNMQKEENLISSFQDDLDSAVNQKSDEELRKACNDFESYFIQTVAKEMLKTVNKDKSAMPNGKAAELFQGMLVEERSKSMATNGGIGLADMMYNQMKLEEQAKADTQEYLESKNQTLQNN